MSFWNWLKSLFVPRETVNEKILKVARAEIGQKEIVGSKHNPRILEYHTKATATGKFKTDEIPWCASFICWVLDKAGLPHTNNALASSYNTYGDKVASIKDALPGDIIVRSRGAGLNHVHILNEKYTGGGYYKGLGGNQSNAVNVGNYTIAGIKHIRRAKQV